LTEGDLIPAIDPHPFALNSESTVAIQVGSGGPIFASENEFRGVPQMFKFAYDAGLRVVRRSGHIEVSTPVRDRGGKLVGEINENHWKVYPPICSDKNYNGNQIEMKDEGGHIVLQVTIFQDKVQVQGEWHDQFGTGVRIMEVQGGGTYTRWLTPEQERKLEQLISPIFQYPSSTHWQDHVGG
jgi:hypothetical protein